MDPEPSPPPGDGKLIVSCLEGSEEAFIGLMRRHQEGLYRLIRGIIRNSLEADELTQETFLRVYRFLDLYRTYRPFRPWLYKTGANLALGRLRRARTARWSAFAQEPGDQAGKLPPLHCAALVLRCVHGLDYREIALILNISEETVLERLQEARARAAGPRGDAGEDEGPGDACASVRRLLGAYWDEELSRGDRRMAEHHLEGCASCRGTYAALDAFSHGLREEVYLLDPGPEYFEELPGRFRQKHDLPSQRGRWSPAAGRGASRPGSGRIRWPHLLGGLVLVGGTLLILHLMGTPPLRPHPPWRKGPAAVAQGTSSLPLPRPQPEAPPDSEMQRELGTLLASWGGGTWVDSVNVSGRTDSSAAAWPESLAREVREIENTFLPAQEGNEAFPDSIWSGSWFMLARSRAREAGVSPNPQDRQAALRAYWRAGHRLARNLYPDSAGWIKAYGGDLRTIRTLLPPTGPS